MVERSARSDLQTVFGAEMPTIDSGQLCLHCVGLASLLMMVARRSSVLPGTDVRRQWHRQVFSRWLQTTQSEEQLVIAHRRQLGAFSWRYLKG